MGHRSRSVLNDLKHHNRHLTDAERAGKYGKMAQSAFRFYRGTNHLFWADFGGDYRLQQFGSHQTRIWLQGDLHIDNYGIYGNDDHTVVYSLNDFDDAIVADYQYDIWRMAISIVLVARQIPSRPFPRSEIEQVIDAFVDGYLDTLQNHQGIQTESPMTDTGNTLTQPLDNVLAKVGDRTTRTRFLNKWTILREEPSGHPNPPNIQGKRVFNYKAHPDKLVPVNAQEWNAIAQQMEHYGSTLTGQIEYDVYHFEIQDIVKRINAGTGSLGATRYYVLIAAGSRNPDKGCILDIKHQIQPTPYAYMTKGDRHTYTQVFGDNHALRHAIAYRALTNKSDDYLGWIHLQDLPNHAPAYFSVRELSPDKRSFDMNNISNFKIFKAIAAQWGLILAQTHVQADEKFDPTFIDYSFEKQIEQLTQGRHDEFRTLVKTIAFPYAEQVETDWQTFLESDLAPRELTT